VVRVFQTLGLPPPALSRSRYALDELTRELWSSPNRGCGYSPSTKNGRVTGSGAIELTRVDAAGGTVWTLAVESEDSAAVMTVVRRLGLAGVRNQSYPGPWRFLLRS